MPARRTKAALTRTSRLEGLSDATFAIVLTLRILEIQMAGGSQREQPANESSGLRCSS
jgi:uncharacterized membrane protein